MIHFKTIHIDIDRVIYHGFTKIYYLYDNNLDQYYYTFLYKNDLTTRYHVFDNVGKLLMVNDELNLKKYLNNSLIEDTCSGVLPTAEDIIINHNILYKRFIKINKII